MNIQKIQSYIPETIRPVIKALGDDARILVEKITQQPKSAIYGAGAIALPLGAYGYTRGCNFVEDKVHSEFTKPSKKHIEPIPELEGKIEPVKIQTKDGINLSCWDINPNNSEKYAIFFHGINSNIGGYQNVYNDLVKKGIGVLAVEYRGYGFNEGNVSEKGLNLDAEAGYNYLIDKGISPENIGAVGHSLGGAVATTLASKKDLGFLILDSTFNNMKNAIKSVKTSKFVKDRTNLPQQLGLSLIPTGAIPLENKFESDKHVKNVKCPILIIHCKNDEVIPLTLAQKLANSATNAKYSEFAVLGNSSIHDFTDEESLKVANFASRVFDENQAEKLAG